MSLKSSAKALKGEAQAPLSLRGFDESFGVPVCGIDEVGRGPLAGPVVAACAYIPTDKINHPVWAAVNDSKKLSPQKREYLFEIIKDQCVFGIAECSPQEIDDLNIHHATLLAMKRAFEVMLFCSVIPNECEESHEISRFARNDNIFLALIDGKFAPALSCKTHTVIKGDSKSLSIAAASILAKVTRDRMMAKLHNKFPHYGWDTNAGYGTATHMDGIACHGITPHHRKSFAPCKG